MRRPTAEEYTHERLGEARFGEDLSLYDTERRVEVLIDEFLGPSVAGRTALDVGCGLGFFSARLHALGADVLAVDIGPGLVEDVRRRVGCAAEVADVLELTRHFGERRFEVVVSSECIEHVPDPRRALEQLATMVAPGGYLAVSTPNLWWNPVVKLATRLRLRPFDGHERFSTWRSLRRTLEGTGLEVVEERGLHLFPFQLPMHPLSRWCDTHLQFLRELMINLCVLARRPG